MSHTSLNNTPQSMFESHGSVFLLCNSEWTCSCISRKLCVAYKLLTRLLVSPVCSKCHLRIHFYQVPVSLCFNVLIWLWKRFKEDLQSLFFFAALFIISWTCKGIFQQQQQKSITAIVSLLQLMSLWTQNLSISILSTIRKSK